MTAVIVILGVLAKEVFPFTRLTDYVAVVVVIFGVLAAERVGFCFGASHGLNSKRVAEISCACGHEKCRKKAGPNTIGANKSSSRYLVAKTLFRRLFLNRSTRLYPFSSRCR